MSSLGARLIASTGQYRYSCAAMSLHHKLASYNDTWFLDTAHQASPYYISSDQQWPLSGLQKAHRADACIAHQCLCIRVGRGHVVPCKIHCC
jgi:hypothetical protein